MRAAGRVAVLQRPLATGSAPEVVLACKKLSMDTWTFYCSEVRFDQGLNVQTIFERPQA